MVYKSLYQSLNETIANSDSRNKLTTFLNYFVILCMVVIGVTALYLPKSEVIGFGILTTTFGAFILFAARNISEMYLNDNISVLFTLLTLGLSGGFILLFISFAIMFFTFITIRVRYKNNTGKEHVLNARKQSLVRQFKMLFIASFTIFATLIILLFACKDELNVDLSFIYNLTHENMKNQLFIMSMLILSGVSFFLSFKHFNIANTFQQYKTRLPN